MTAAHVSDARRLSWVQRESRHLICFIDHPSTSLAGDALLEAGIRATGDANHATRLHPQEETGSQAAAAQQPERRVRVAHGDDDGGVGASVHLHVDVGLQRRVSAVQRLCLRRRVARRSSLSRRMEVSSPS